uniref:Sec1 family domain-containing protein 1 n=1 Tax=Parastrongyloides trichosuri TaxID=131310 RepID=A0A0N4ZMQ5_PARTI
MLKSNDTIIKDSVRYREILALKQLLSLNTPAISTLSSEPVWKILIIDKYGQDIISPLLSVKQLRELGVTLHLMLPNKREPLPDVPAVYFISPTEENISLLCDDLKSAMYDSFYINMIYPMSRIQLENLATAAVHGGTMQQVQKLTDQYLNFIALEDDFFILKRFKENSSISYHAMNDPTISVQQMDALIDEIAKSLFSICVTMGIVPIIRCGKDNAAEQVAIKLDQKIRDSLRDARNNLFTQDSFKPGQMKFQRPVLVIADRGLDLATMLHHTWTYQALIHDVLDFDLNRIVMVDKTGKKKDYEMCSIGDNLWKNHRGSAFPLVAEAIQEDLEAYRKNEDEIKRLKNVMGMENIENEDAALLLGSTTSKLQSAVESLPELLEKKRLIDLHTNVATTVLDIIKERKLDTLFEYEEKILNRQAGEINIKELMKNCSNPMDALRLCLINYLCSTTITEEELKEQTDILEERQVSLDAIAFAKRIRSFSNMNKMGEMHQGAGTKTVSMFSKLLNQSSKFVMEGVKNLVPKKHNLPLTQMVDKIIDTRPSVTGVSSADSDEYRYFDPKIMHAASKDMLKPKSGQLAQDVIVFQIGGGNYVEYQNLVEYAKTKGIERLTYGCTELVTPKQFIEQLEKLGSKLRS